MEQQPDIYRLVSLAQKGDADAFAELYSLYYSRLYRTALSLMKRREDAEDVVMEAVSSAFRAISSLREPEKFEHWLFTLLYNTAKRRLKLNSRRGITAELSDDIPSEDGQIEQAELRELLSAARARLSDEENAIITLSVMNGYSSDEVGSIMGLRPGTVRSKLSRSLSKLRSALEDKI